MNRARRIDLAAYALAALIFAVAVFEVLK